MQSVGRAYPGVYFIRDPRPGCARADVAALVRHAGTLHDRTVALTGDDWALIAVAPPVAVAGVGPGVCERGGDLLVWTGDMALPSDWMPAQERSSIAADRMADAAHARLVRHRPAILAGIDGAFCGIWHEAAADRWHIFNDRWGLMPLFWWAADERLVVSPKARFTWWASDKSLRVDERGVADLLRTQNMLDDHTLIEGVHWLEPAHVVTWRPARNAGAAELRSHRYWDFQHRPQHGRRYDDVLDAYVHACEQTVRRMTAGDVPLLQGISGGLDSRLFLAMCDRIGRVPTCFTSGFVYGEDMRFGRQLARAAGATHVPLLFEETTLPRQLFDLIIETDGLHAAGHLTLSTPIPAFLNERNGTILLEGYLHGVLGGSDLPADEDVLNDRLPHAQTWAHDFLHSGGGSEIINALLRPDLARQSEAFWCEHVDRSFRNAPVDDPLHRAEYTIITGRSGRNDVLVPASARRDVLARHPATDRAMLEWCAATPALLRRARQTYIDVLRRYFPRFARVPRADGCAGLPLASGRLLREWCWQREKLHRIWARWRHAKVRRWGNTSAAVRAWAFDICRRAGMFDELLAPDARVLEWVQRPTLMQLWQRCDAEPACCVVMLSLVTIETMVRAMEAMPPLALPGGGQAIHFRAVERAEHARIAMRR